MWSCLFFAAALCSAAPVDCDPKPVIKISVDEGHPWRPPFGLDRIGRPTEIVIESDRNNTSLILIERRGEKKSKWTPINLPEKPPFIARVSVKEDVEEVSVVRDCEGKTEELAKITIERPVFEAEAVAKPETIINPVDLGTILVPADWLLLGPGQRGMIDVALISRDPQTGEVWITVWYDSDPEASSPARYQVQAGVRRQISVGIPIPSSGRDKDTLHVVITGGKREYFHKQITTMLVHKPPQWPKFGAVEAKLRYDAPISLKDPQTGALSTMPYEEGWRPELNDVVVCLPNGARFVFWRGSCYIPFWASRYNTGLSYEWAETGPLPEGFEDSVEPLMDKELRYGRVEIIESTSARVHVRWTYQSTDFNYKVWGDQAIEDFYFYPDGFGTRCLTLRSALNSDYEISELIIIAPQNAIPFAILPPNLVDAVFLDGQKHSFTFPADSIRDHLKHSRNLPAIYRIRLNNDDPQTAIYFHPQETQLPPHFFTGFMDRGQLVTPVYWGSHWPLARGKTTGYAIDDRIHVTPSHNSVMSWVRQRPPALQTTTMPALDTLGESKPMKVEQWVWMIGLTDQADEEVLERARSFNSPPSVALKGARLDFESFAPQRRAIRLVVEESQITVTLKPTVPCIDPVFELLKAPSLLSEVRLGEQVLNPGDYAWDGQTLWLKARIHEPTDLHLNFAQ
jgi:hypothetical protein